MPFLALRNWRDAVAEEKRNAKEKRKAVAKSQLVNI